MMHVDGDAGMSMPCSSNAVTSPTQPPAPIRKRRFSSAKIQPTRVKKVMQSDEEIGRMVASVPVAIGRAMEHFAEKFLETAANCVQCTTSRTLSPAHMKLAMMRHRHFAFLEPLMRDITLPPPYQNEPVWTAESIPQPTLPLMISTPMDAYYASALMNQQQPGMAMPSYVPQVIGVPSWSGGASSSNVLPRTSNIPMPITSTGTSNTSISTTPSGTKRRQNNGAAPEPTPDGKPKRGRPRKVKKEEKCVDDEGVFIDTTGSRSVGGSNGAGLSSTTGSMTSMPIPPQHQPLSDSQLMPPPCLPSINIQTQHKMLFSPAAAQMVPLQSVAVPSPVQDVITSGEDVSQHNS